MGRPKEREDKRTLTKAEQQRKENFEKVSSSMQAKGYTAVDLTISVAYANIMAFVLGIPIIVLLGIAFFAKNSIVSMMIGMSSAFIFIAVFIALIFVHELIHGATWAIFAGNHWQSISFGFMVKYLTPYCCCQDVLKKSEYILGGIMPTVILGIIPALVAVFTGSYSLFLIGALMILAGGGDLTIILKLICFRASGSDIMYIDHPYKCGLMAFVKQAADKGDPV